MTLMRLMVVVLLLCVALSSRSQTISSWKVTALQNYINNSDSVLVINFWATFCKPCVEELPYFIATIDKYKNQKVKLLMVSLDLPDFYPDKIAAFAKKNNYTPQIVWLNETNADYFCPKVDKKWTGGIPSTYFVNPKTGYRKFVEEQMKPEQFETELKKAMESKKPA